MHKLINKISKTAFLIIPLIVLSLSLRGLPGNPNETDLLNKKWKEYGPFELSPERGRFALIYSIIENNSLQYTLNIARFTAPDVGYSDGKYMSLFAPGLSYLVIPGYLVGKSLGASQVGAYFIISIFAIFNVLLIKKIGQKMGLNVAAAMSSAVLFLFGTPAFSYAVNLYQHHVSTFIILLSVYALQNWKNIKGYALVFFLCGLSIVIDNPNFFFMAPIAIAAVIQIIKVKDENKKNLKISLNVGHMATMVLAVFPLFLLLTFNYYSHGDPYKLSGSLKAAEAIDENGIPYDPDVRTLQAQNSDLKNKKKDPVGFFKTRNILNGIYIHTVSPDRGTFFYAPIVFFGVWGLIISKKQSDILVKTIISVVSVIVLLYSMWGDPWGGWAFGSRYLIPAYALLSIFIGFWIQKYYKNILLMTVLLVVAFYSFRVNTIGAITSSVNPPQVQVLYLESLSGQVEKYTVDRNIDAVNQSNLKSYIYQSNLHNYFTGWQYYGLIMTMGMLVLVLTLLPMYVNSKKGDMNE